VLPAACNATDTPAMMGERSSHRASPAASDATATGVTAARRRHGPTCKLVQPSAKKMKQRDAAEKLNEHFSSLKHVIEASKQPDPALAKVWNHRSTVLHVHADLTVGYPDGVASLDCWVRSLTRQ
jgi:hypothetical protein